MHPCHRWTVLFALAIPMAAAPRRAPAQEPLLKPTPAAAPAGLATRVFDVRDLTFVAPDHPLGGSLVPPTRIPIGNQAAAAQSGGQNVFASGGGNGSDKPPTTLPNGIDGIRRLIIQTVEPNSWKDNGGDAGSVAATDAGLLFVTQTPDALREVAALLDQLRQGRTGMVRVRADWVLLPPGQVGRLYKNGPDDTAALPQVNRAVLDGLPHWSAALACVSGQTVHLTSGQARTLVTAATPVVAPGSVAFDVQQTLVQYGLALQVTPTVGGDTATLDLTSVASRTPDVPTATTRPADGSPPAMAGPDRFSDVVQSLQTTAQVPVGRPVLVGGMTLDAGAGSDGPELYLIVEADTGK
jgi:hypothetical protein